MTILNRYFLSRVVSKFDGLVSHKRLLEGLEKRGVTCLLSFLKSSPP
jgi:hypothetical protein